MALPSAVRNDGRTPPLRQEDFRKRDDSQHEKTGGMPIRLSAVTQKAQWRANSARHRVSR
jgi:hypothetical protein